MLQSPTPRAGNGQRQWTTTFLLIARQKKYPQAAYALAMALVELHLNRRTGQLNPKYDVLAKTTGGYSEKAIQRAGNILERDGLIKRHHPGQHGAVEFTLTDPHSGWTSGVHPDVQSDDPGWTSPTSRVDINGVQGGHMVSAHKEHRNTIKNTVEAPSARDANGFKKVQVDLTRPIRGWEAKELNKLMDRIDNPRAGSLIGAIDRALTRTQAQIAAEAQIIDAVPIALPSPDALSWEEQAAIASAVAQKVIPEAAAIVGDAFAIELQKRLGTKPLMREVLLARRQSDPRKYLGGLITIESSSIAPY